MSVATVITAITVDARRNPDLPKGLQPFMAFATSTGDGTAGNIDFSFQFNPGGGRTFQPYVAIEEMNFVSSVADPTDGLWRIISADWERLVNADSGGTSQDFPIITEESNGLFYWNDKNWRYLGRAQLGTTAKIFIRMPNVDTAVLNFWIKGLVADRPFVVPAELSV